MIIRYKLVGGEVKREILAASRHTRSEDRPLPFHQTLLNAHYQCEIEQGSRYRSGYPKSVTKRVLEGALARGGAS